jgi:DNA-binding transcriptional LysR family regulator
MEEQETLFRSRAIDIGFARSRIRGEGIVFEPLFEDKLALIFPAAAAKSRDPKKRIAELSALPLISFPHLVAQGLTDRLKAICKGYGSGVDTLG